MSRVHRVAPGGPPARSLSALVGCVVLVAIVPFPAGTAELSGDWQPLSGRWDQVIDVRPAILQRSPTGRCTLLRVGSLGSYGAWRSWVQPSPDVRRCGLWFLASRDLRAGFRCELGGNPSVGGFCLKDARGTVLWEDRWAPWRPYQAVVLEGIVERGRVRVQMFEYDGKTLISQSDWIRVPTEQAEREGHIGLYTEDGVAWFWDVAQASTALAEITPEAPNRRRLVQGKPDDWKLFGTGNWMWTDSRKRRVRQYARTERAWALTPQVRGKDRVWRSWVRVDPGTGGAGMIVQADAQCRGGYVCWLGGTPGAGCLMLYRNGGPGGAGHLLWAGAQDRWHFREDLLLQAETRGGKVRLQLFGSDGHTLIAESPWIETDSPSAGREGYLALHTWKGPAEFWGFQEDTTTETSAAQSPTPEPTTQRGEWLVLGRGSWTWNQEGSTIRVRTGPKEVSTCLNRRISGSRGTWRCRVMVSGPAQEAGLLFQADPSMRTGFALLLTASRVRLVDLSRPNSDLWSSGQVHLVPGRELVLEEMVLTDRTAVRILDPAQPGTILCESPPLYVAETNNTRIGHLGLRVAGGQARFTDWGFEPDD